MHHVDDVVKARLKQIRMSSLISAVICPQNICLVSASKAEQTAGDSKRRGKTPVYCYATVTVWVFALE